MGRAVVPLTVAILVILFLIQRNGTSFIGGIFGPVMLIWFIVAGVLGVVGIVRSPAILTALSPLPAVTYFWYAGPLALVVIGGAFLAVTGGEAFYADMGHFGPIPIRIAWFGVALPALTLNYFGQGGLLLAEPNSPEVIDSLFYALAPQWSHYSETGRPSIDPELTMGMLIVGYGFGIRSERRLCEEVHLNLAYRWFCRLGLDGDVPDHSTFSKNRHGRFRESDLLRKLFETVVARCMKEGIVGGEAFAVDASIIVADAHRRRSVAKVEDLDPTSSRAVAEYLSVLDDAAFGGATPIEPKAISSTDPAARYTASANSVAGYAYSDNYLVDLKHAVIMDVEATTTIRQAEVGAAKTMLDRTAEQFEVAPSRLVADAGYGSAEMIGWRWTSAESSRM
jgi:transposase